MEADCCGDISEAFGDYLLTAIEGLRHFINHASPATIVATRSARIKCDRLSEEHLLLFLEVAEETLHMRIDLCPFWWADSRGKRTHDIDQFMDDGRLYESLLAKPNLSRADRAWRIRALTMDQAAIDRLHKYLSPDDFTTALRWIEEGV